MNLVRRGFNMVFFIFSRGLQGILHLFIFDLKLGGRNGLVVEIGAKRIHLRLERLDFGGLSLQIRLHSHHLRSVVRNI